MAAASGRLFGESGRIAATAPWRDRAASGDGIPGGLGKFDIRSVGHAV